MHFLLIDTDKEGEYPVIDQNDPGEVSFVLDFIASKESMWPWREKT